SARSPEPSESRPCTCSTAPAWRRGRATGSPRPWSSEGEGKHSVAHELGWAWAVAATGRLVGRACRRERHPTDRSRAGASGGRHPVARALTPLHGAHRNALSLHAVPALPGALGCLG